MNVSMEKLLAAVKAKGYPLHEDDSKPFHINVIGIRSIANVPNSFDDTVVQMWKYQKYWNYRTYPCTTDPGNYWLQNPQNVHGTAIVKEGYYKDLWDIGLHQGKYKALVQANPITVYRDNNKDLKEDLINPETGIFGINCHRANENGQSISNDKWSAGCQVLQNRLIFNPDNHAVKVYEFDYFMNLVDKSKENWNEKFSYILLNEKDII